MSAHQIQQFLEKTGAKYVDSAKTDVLGALREFRDLVPGYENFMYPDGKRKPAFKLKGTIPVHYKGSVYNIPISVYLWDTHPYYAPICYVNPTSTMVIKESENVNKQGRVFLPYLNEWRFPGYDLNGLIQVMAMVFQERCPLFAKPIGGITTSASSTTSTSQPSAIQHPSPYPSVYSGQSAGMPPYPIHNPTPYPSQTPYPGAAGYNGYSAYPTAGNAYNPYANLPQADRPTPPPIPPPPACSSDTVQPEHIRASVLSAMEDKLKMKLRDKIGTSQAELSSIRQTQMELRSGQQKLKQITDELESQQKQLENFIFVYQDKKCEFERAFSECGVSGEQANIDEAIDTGTPLHKQLLDNYAKDLACDDAIYVLGQALKHSTITLPEYLKQIRNVSRKQFIYRTTMQKCRKIGNLPV